MPSTHFNQTVDGCAHTAVWLKWLEAIFAILSFPFPEGKGPWWWLPGISAFQLGACDPFTKMASSHFSLTEGQVGGKDRAHPYL